MHFGSEVGWYFGYDLSGMFEYDAFASSPFSWHRTSDVMLILLSFETCSIRPSLNTPDVGSNPWRSEVPKLGIVNYKHLEFVMGRMGEICWSSPIRAQAHCSGAFFEEVVWRVSINRSPFVRKIVDITVLSCSLLFFGSSIEDTHSIMPMLGPTGLSVLLRTWLGMIV